MEEPILNAHNKEEFPPAHTAEHILNATMVKMWNCGRAVGGHVERKKSKLDYNFSRALTPDELTAIEQQVNAVIESDLPVTKEFIMLEEAKQRFPCNRLPEQVSEMVRVIHVGDYDECLCAGKHVEHTAQVGKFRITSSRYEEGRLRLIFKVDVLQG